MSRRRAQVESTLKRALSEVLARKVSDPRIRGLVSVTQVDLAPNFKSAVIYVSVIPEQYVSRTIHGLNSGAGMFQSHLAKSLPMKVIPQLVFKHDDGSTKEANVFDDIQRGLDREGLSAVDVKHVGEGDETTNEDQTLTDNDELSANSTEKPTP